jgi:hypothetical protein
MNLVKTKQSITLEVMSYHVEENFYRTRSTLKKSLETKVSLMPYKANQSKICF